MSTIKIKQEGSLEYTLDRGYVAKVEPSKCVNCGTAGRAVPLRPSRRPSAGSAACVPSVPTSR